MKQPDTLEQGRLWLRNRRLRRKLMGAVLILLLAAIAMGSWVLDGWLAGSVARFGIYWGAVMLYTLLLLMLTIYDMLRAKNGG